MKNGFLYFLVSLLFLSLFYVSAATIVRVNIQNSAVIRSQFSTYWDAACTREVVNIDWGFLEPASTKTVTIYLRNIGSAAVLNMTVTNWSPADVNSYITLTWDREGFKIAQSQTVVAKLTLHISKNIQGIKGFSFQIFIQASY